MTSGIRAVLTAVAERAGWPKPSAPGRALGIACGTEKGSYVATAAEVSRAPGGFKVERIVIAFECGAIVNPDGLRNQVEGSVVQGLGGALFEAIEFRNGRILNASLEQYRVPRFADVPAIDTILIDRHGPCVGRRRGDPNRVRRAGHRLRRARVRHGGDGTADHACLTGRARHGAACAVLGCCRIAASIPSEVTSVRTLRAIPALVCALAITAAAAQKSSAINIPFEKYTLPNGLTVIHAVDRSTPTVAVNMWFHVGSKNEEPGRTGFAHLFEHVMFTGSGNVPYGLHDKLTNGVGGGNNGTTNNDRTSYYETVPSNYLESTIWLEADRMGFLLDALDIAKLNAQRDIVKNERRQGVDNQPYGRAGEIISAALYPPSNPYSWDVIGSMADLSAASEDDVKNFFRLYYAPNNAIMSIVGDFDPAQAKAWVTKYFGDIPRGKTIIRPAVRARHAPGRKTAGVRGPCAAAATLPDVADRRHEERRPLRARGARSDSRGPAHREAHQGARLRGAVRRLDLGAAVQQRERGRVRRRRFTPRRAHAHGAGGIDRRDRRSVEAARARPPTRSRARLPEPNWRFSTGSSRTWASRTSSPTERRISAIRAISRPTTRSGAVTRLPTSSAWR